MLILALGLMGANRLEYAVEPIGPPDAPAEPVYDVQAYGATVNDSTLDTDAINAAIEAAAEAGGGRVYFPPGTYLSFSIHSHLQITLHLEQGAW